MIRKCILWDDTIKEWKLVEIQDNKVLWERKLHICGKTCLKNCYGVQ